MSPNYDVEMRLDVKIPMRDGVNLSADIYLPRADGPFPTILERTAFSQETFPFVEKGRALANLGYVYVVQDFRGRHDSEGENIPFYGQGEDGYDTQEWIGRQPWSNGKIGMTGGSYMGIVQWQSAVHRSEHLTCMVPQIAICDHVADALAPGGAFQLTWLMPVAATGGILSARTSQHGADAYRNWIEVYRTLPLADFEESVGITAPHWKDWLQRPLDDDYWTALNVETRWSDIAAPAFIMGGWYDVHAQSAFTFYSGMSQHGGTPEARQSKLIVGPWIHSLSSSSKTGDIDFGIQAGVGLDQLASRWFDYWLKGIDNGILDEPPVRLFIMGINEWRNEQEWPLARTDYQKWYMHSDGCANTVRGDGGLSALSPMDEPADRFVYDPDYPAQTIGGNNLFPGVALR
jgi:putative CocE/NonD family hydrolase